MGQPPPRRADVDGRRETRGRRHGPRAATPPPGAGAHRRHTRSRETPRGRLPAGQGPHRRARTRVPSGRQPSRWGLSVWYPAPRTLASELVSPRSLPAGLLRIGHRGPQLAEQPRPGASPIALDGGRRQLEGVGRFLDGQASEEPQHHQVAQTRVDGRELAQRGVEVEQVHVRRRRRADRVRERHLQAGATPFGGRMGAGMIHQDLPHHARGNREEVRAVLPAHAAQVHQAQVRLVDEGGRSQGVVGPLRAQSPARDPTQILVHNCDQPAVRGPIPRPQATSIPVTSSPSRDLTLILATPSYPRLKVDEPLSGRPPLLSGARGTGVDRDARARDRRSPTCDERVGWRQSGWSCWPARAVWRRRLVTATERQRRERRHRACSEATLRGAYGLQFQGTRPVRPPFPPGIESFIGIAIRTYDGEGQFTQISNVKGAVIGVEEDVESTGTYQVNEDCSGSDTCSFSRGARSSPIGS